MEEGASTGFVSSPSPARRTAILHFLIPVSIVACFVAFLVWWKTPPGDPLVRAEKIHGIQFPPSAGNIQGRGDAWGGFIDRGEATVFEMKGSELAGFVAGLKIRSRNFPVSAEPADPTVNGWNVWPHTAKSFVPGNGQYAGFSKTWMGDAVPVEMLSCDSPKGDRLHVEYWKLAGGDLLVKMFTEWN